MSTSTVVNEVVSAPLPPPKDSGGTVMSSLGLDIPLSPAFHSPLQSPVDKTRKYNSLTDLIESEKAYVELLTGIIRKVAAAWSRSNLPPSELDIMFRSVEGVYKTNRALLAKLKELGENPSSPKALGDLLMRWIDELEQPYMTYADRYSVGFDDWEPVRSNPKLSVILQTFSSSHPPPSTLPQPTRLRDPTLWTLDALFLLPRGRLQYYRKLYSRLLKSTTPGKSDHRLLTGALGKLDGLLVTLDERANTGVGPPQTSLSYHANAGPNPTTTTLVEPSPDTLVESTTLLSGQFSVGPTSAATSMRGSFSSRDERLSQETASTSISRGSSQAMSSSVLDLEKRLATESTLDIFTMEPKQIRLQIAPPTLPYARELRSSARVVIRFTSKATGVEVIHRYGHVYILSDLFLLCKEMTREERAARSEDGKDMHLCYPPLSGKVLNVTGVPGQENALQVSILRKETLILEADSQLKRDRILDEFEECISFAKTISRAAQEPVPPMPPISGFPQSSVTGPRTSGGSLKERPERALNPRLLSPSQPSKVQTEDVTPRRALAASSPRQNNTLPLMPFLQSYPEQENVVSNQLEAIQDSLRNVAGSPLGGPASPQRAPSSHNPGSVYPPRRSSAGLAINNPPSFSPGQIVPLLRNTSIQSQSSPFMMSTSDLSGSQGRQRSPPTVQNHPPQNSGPRHHASMRSLRQQPLQSQPSLPHQPNHSSFTPAPNPQPGPYPLGVQSFSSHQSNPPIISPPHEQSSRKLQKSQSLRSLHAQYQHSQAPLPPVPSLPDDLPMPQPHYTQRKDSASPLNSPASKPFLPTMQMRSRANSIAEPSILDPSPPSSPAEERKPLGPVRLVVTAQKKCKVFLQQQHAQWKSLGSANLMLYQQEPTNVKQLVVEAGNKDKSILISTIVLTDGVERVGKTGIAIELSDARGARTGVIYMIQLRNEDDAGVVFKALLAGSDRAA